MDLLHHIKSDFLGFYKNKYSLISLLFTPLLLTFILSLSIENSNFKSYEEFKINLFINYTNNISTNNINTNDGNNGNKEVYDLLTTYFSSDRFKNIIYLVPKEKAQVIINILDTPNGLNAVNIENIKMSKGTGEVIELLTEELLYNNILTSKDLDKINVNNIPLNKESGINLDKNLLNSVMEKEKVNVKTIALKEKDNKKGPLPYAFLAAFTILPYIIVTNTMAMNVKKEFLGIRKRSLLIPIHPLNSNIYSLLSNICVQIPAWLIFIIFSKIIDPMAFRGNIFNYIIIATIIFMFLSSLTEIIATLINYKASYVIIFFLYICNLLAVVVPYEKLNSLYGGILVNFPIIKYLYISYHKVYEAGNLSSFTNTGLILVIISLILILMERFILKRRLKL